MNFLQRLFGQSENTAQSAKTRLRAAIAQDRSELSPDTLDTLRSTISDAVSQYMEIDRDNVQVSVSREGEEHNLVANIPVTSTRPTVRRRATARRPIRAARTTRTANTE